MKPIGDLSLKALGSVAEERRRVGLELITAATNETDPEQRCILQWEALAELAAAGRLEALHRDHVFFCMLLDQQGDLQRLRREGIPS